MEYKTIGKRDFRDFVNRLIQGDHEINGVVRKGTAFVYDTLVDTSDLCLDYDETLLPPKKYFLPVKETLLTFKTGDPSSYHESVEAEPRIIIGIHPWDLAAIALLDKAFSMGQSDVNYLSRRNQSLLIGIYPTRAFKHRFSGSMITDEHYQTADLMLVDLGNDAYGIEVVTDEGRALIMESAAVPADEHAIENMERRKHVVQDEAHLSMPGKDLPEFLKKQQLSKVIDRRADRCFSCGSCVPGLSHLLLLSCGRRGGFVPSGGPTDAHVGRMHDGGVCIGCRWAQFQGNAGESAAPPYFEKGEVPSRAFSSARLCRVRPVCASLRGGHRIPSRNHQRNEPVYLSPRGGYPSESPNHDR